MFRRKLKTFAASLALAGLLVLNLHVLAHLLGHDDDDHGPGAAPCSLCQTVLAQHSLAAAPSVEAPTAVTIFVFICGAAPLVRERPMAVGSDSRGPPMHALV